MKLDSFATAKNEQEGKWVQAVVFGEKKDFEILIYGANSDIVCKKQFDILKQYRNETKDRDFYFEEIKEKRTDNIACYIGGVREIGTHEIPTLFGKKVDNEEAYKEMLEAIPDLKIFVENYAKETQNFLSEERKN